MARNSVAVEYALPSGRKEDPRFEIDAFRAAVAAIPAVEPTAQPAAQVGRTTLRRGMHGEFVRQIQRKLKIADNSIFGADTEVAAREFQRTHNLVPDGIVGPKIWRVFDTVQ